MAVRLLFTACGVLVLAACNQPPASDEERAGATGAPPVQTPIVARFQCDGALVTATFYGDRVTLEMPNRNVTLPHVVAASGARYSDGVATFWNKGSEAMLELDGRSRSCRIVRDPWQEARGRGIDFRAVGQEPGWYLEIDNGKSMRLVYDYAEREAMTPVPQPVSRQGSTTYDATTEAHRLRVILDERSCSDAMSGESFPRAVTVEIDGRSLRGCGRPLDALR
jgi:putative lipoprotein